MDKKPVTRAANPEMIWRMSIVLRAVDIIFNFLVNSTKRRLHKTASGKEGFPNGRGFWQEFGANDKAWDQKQSGRD
jgi:hypothetical protein